VVSRWDLGGILRGEEDVICTTVSVPVEVEWRGRSQKVDQGDEVLLHRRLVGGSRRKYTGGGCVWS
jgi:hypothetical protein